MVYWSFENDRPEPHTRGICAAERRSVSPTSSFRPAPVPVRHFATGRGTTHEPDRAEPAADQVHAQCIHASRSRAFSESMICGGDPCRTGAVPVLQPSLCVPARSPVRVAGCRAPPASKRPPADPLVCRRAEEVCPFRHRQRHRGRAVRRGCRGPLAARCAGKRRRGGDGAPTRQVLRLPAGPRAPSKLGTYCPGCLVYNNAPPDENLRRVAAICRSGVCMLRQVCCEMASPCGGGSEEL